MTNDAGLEQSALIEKIDRERTNDAAERAARAAFKQAELDRWNDAECAGRVAAERRATVERIRIGLNSLSSEGDTRQVARKDIHAILDAEDDR